MRTRTLFGTTGLLVRHLRTRPGGGVLLASVVLVLAFLATAAPRAAADLHTDALHYDLAALDPTARDLSGQVIGVPPLGAGSGDGDLDPAAAEVWGAFDDTVSRVRDGFPSPLHATTDDAEYLLAVDAVAIEYPGSGPHAKLSFAFDPRSGSRVQYDAGRAPESTSDDILEIGLATASAADLGWTVGDERIVDLGDGRSTHVLLSGTYSAAHRDDEYWNHAPLLLQTSVEDEGFTPVYTGTGLVAAAEVETLDAMHAPPRLSVWFPLHADAVAIDQASVLEEQLRKQSSTTTGIVIERPGFRPTPLVLASDADDAIAASLSRASSMDAVLAMTASGPIGVALAVLVLGARIVSIRRDDALRLLAARGASPAQLRGLMALEGVVLGLPAALIGCILALLATPGAPLAGELVLPVLLALAPGVILAVTTNPAPHTVRTDLVTSGGGRARLIAEGVVIALAIVATVVLVRRGLSAATAAAGVDPLLVAVPLLLSFAACIIALRLYPLPLGMLATRGRARRGLLGLLGPLRALRDPAAGLTPVFALVVGVAVAITSGVLLTTTLTGIEAAARASVGADVRVSGAPLTDDQVSAIAALPGVTASVAASEATGVSIEADGRQTYTSVIVVDASALDAVQAGHAGGVDTAELRGGGKGIRALVSSPVASTIGGADGPTIDGDPLQVVGTLDGPTALSPRGNWVIIDESNAPDVTGSLPLPRVMLLRLDGTADAGAVVASATRIAGEGATVTTPAIAAAGLLASPSVSGLQAELLAAIVVASLLSALALAMTLALGTATRARMTALLRLLGAPGRSARSLLVWEIAPPVVAAIVVGVALGIGLPQVVLAGVDLRGFTGGRAQPSLAVDPLLTAVLGVGFLVVTAAMVAVALRSSRGTRASTILRTVEDA